MPFFVSPDWKFLTLTAVAVTLLGFQAVSDVAEEPPASEVGLASAGENESTRSPASIPRSQFSLVKAVSSSLPQVFLEWNWNCGQDRREEKVQGSQVRLKGKSCLAEFAAERLMITNESNGFTASIFDRGRQNYETDLIPLRQGLNTLRVQYTNSSGRQFEKVLTIHAASTL